MIKIYNVMYAYMNVPELLYTIHVNFQIGGTKCEPYVLAVLLNVMYKSQIFLYKNNNN
jgi:hypothetical protein